MQEAYLQKIEWIREELKHVRVLSLSLITLCLSTIYLCITVSEDISKLININDELKLTNSYMGNNSNPSIKLRTELKTEILKKFVLPMLNEEIRKATKNHPKLSFYIPLQGNYDYLQQLVSMSKTSAIDDSSVNNYIITLVKDWRLHFFKPALNSQSGRYLDWKLVKGTRPPLNVGENGESAIMVSGLIVDRTKNIISIELFPESSVDGEERLNLTFKFTPTSINQTFISSWQKRSLPTLTSTDKDIKDMSIENAIKWSENKFNKEAEKTKLNFLSFTIRGDVLRTFVPWVIVILLIHLTSFIRNIRKYTIENEITEILSPTLHVSKGITNRVLSFLTLIILPLLTLLSINLLFSLKEESSFWSNLPMYLTCIFGTVAWVSSYFFYHSLFGGIIGGVMNFLEDIKNYRK